MNRSLRSLVAIAVSAILYAAGSVSADGECRQMKLSVRAIRASAARSDESGSDVIKVDRRLADLREQLSRIPFQSFSLVSVQQKGVAMKKKEALSMPGGGTLFVRPLYAENHKIGIWLRWQEADGGEILDTRLHLEPGESVIAGTDSTRQTGLLLALELEPVMDRPSE